MAESKYLKQVQGNGASTTLSSSMSDSDTATPLTSDTAFQGEGMVIIDEGTDTEELAYATGKVGSSLTTLVADRGLEGGSPQAHNATATVKGILTAGMWNNVIATLTNGFLATTGAVDPSKILPTSYLDTDDTLAANSDTKIASQKAVKTYADTKLSSSSTILTTGWIADANTWTYASADSPTFTLTVNADVTGFIGVGDRIKLTQTTVKYFIVTAISYGAPNTTITLYGGTDYTLANAAITLPYYSHVKNPLGFPADPTKWTVELSDTTDRQQASPVSGTWYNLGSLSISVPIGVWNVNYIAEVESNRTTSGYFEQYLTLSTANNSESDVDFTTNCYGSATGATGTNFSLILFKSKVLSLASKTAYYINAKTTQSSVTVLGLKNGNTKMFVRAVCAYL